MAGMFSKLVYNNIRPTDEEEQSLDLQMIERFQLKEAKSGFSPKIAVDCFDKRPIVDDAEGCSEDNATAILDALEESIVNHNSDNTNVGTSTIVHAHNDHMCYVFKDVEGVSADFGPAILKCLVAAIENQKPDNDNVGTSNMRVDYSITLPESAQVELDVILKVIAAPVDDVPIEVVPPTESIVNQHDISDSQFSLDFPDVVVVTHQVAKTPAKIVKRIRTRSKIFKSPYTTEYDSGSKAIGDQIEEQKQQLAFDGFLISDTMSSSVIEEFKQDCGVFVAGYAEYLSEEMNVPSDDFEAEYHRMRYATLLQKYGIQKTKKDYASENDDPPRSKSRIIQIPDDNAIVCIE
ncbi:hypothetical protein T459_14812 [Capsicum annuum]|uniref:Uncharacterized protein n=1 Tax=Capsicum annuum TaxID=4072 RepID=A0A2G2ZIG2_CAPAN|nr:hypothetical protein T459_14812 [Capsicum annuum]